MVFILPTNVVTLQFKKRNLSSFNFKILKNIIENCSQNTLLHIVFMRNKRIRFSRQLSPGFLKTSDILSPSSTSRQQIQLPQPSNIDPHNNQQSPRMQQNMLHNMKIKFLLNNLIKKFKHLTPLHTVPPNVTQQWQQSAEQQDEQPEAKKQYVKESLSEEVRHRYELFRHLSIIQGVLIGIICWLVTVSIVFRVKTGYQFFIASLIFSCARMLFLAFVAYNQRDNQQSPFSINFYDDFASPLLLSLTCLLFLLRDLMEIGSVTYVIEVFAVVTVLFQYRQIELDFMMIGKWAEQKRMKKELRIIILFLFVITFAHIFVLGLLLYIASYLTPTNQSNWMQAKDLDHRQWYIQYIYCFYWAITTMVTVGYGDLTPQNYIQVIFVMMIQLFGTAVFGYMINVIGITLDEIKKKNEQFENYQQTIDKLRDHYQLSRELCHKMKHDIRQKENQFKTIPLKTVQQKNFLQYIQPNLKQEFVLETNMRVIKKSIFFLTHFSVNFQNQIALRLIRIIYKPGEEVQIGDELMQDDGERSLVIVNSGWVDIFIETRHNSIQVFKKVRQLKPSTALTNNVFGYSSLIMNKTIRLKGLTKQAAVSYVLKRKDVLQCIQKSMLDFQSFNQMRQKMLMYKLLQEVEAPTLRQNDYHYTPNIFLLVKKITYENQGRMYYMRARMRSKMKVITVKNYQNKTLPKLDDEVTDPYNYNHNFTIDDDFKSLASIDTDNRVDDKNKQLSPANNADPDVFMSKLRIDQCKIFQNFMKSSNLPVVASNYQKACQKKSYRKRMNTSIIKKKRDLTEVLNILHINPC